MPAVADLTMIGLMPALPESLLTARKVSDHLRLLMQPKYFGTGRQLMTAEATIFSWMKRLCPSYLGGHWEFYEISNGGFVMLLDSDDPIDLEYAENYTRTQMSRRSACMVASLFAYSHLHERTGDDRFAKLYRNLIEYASTTWEWQSIRSVID